MRNKLFACLLTLVLTLSLLPGTFAAAAADVDYPNGGSYLFNAAGELVNGTTLGQNGSVVKVTKTVDQYVLNNERVENQFVVTLQVQTSQDIKEIAVDTPDTAVLLVMDVSNSMDDCVNCGNELSHSDHKGTSSTIYYCYGTSGNTYSSYGGNRCRHCGQRRSAHNAVTNTSVSTCNYRSRLDVTKAAAKDFIYDFAENTGAQQGDKRWVAIASYGSHAVTALDWTDVSTTSGMYAFEHTLSGLGIGNSQQNTYNLQGGGTSIESGLTLARNLLGESAISNVDYRYTILLTDGQPTYGVSDSTSTGTSAVYGDTSTSGSSTQESDINNVASVAASIRATSKLYSVCFGKSNGQEVWNLTPFGDWSEHGVSSSTTVGAWMTGFSTAAYKSNDASSAQLFDTFSNILAQIQIAARAWKVEDWMGDYAVYEGPLSGYDTRNKIIETPNASDYADNNPPEFVWDLLMSHTNDSLTNWNTTTHTGTLGYEHKYLIKLDNLDTGYTGGATNANTLATLRYATTDANGNWPESVSAYKTATFPKPQIQGLTGSFSFEKVKENGDPLSGWKFRLVHSNHDHTHPDGNEWSYVEATSGSDGIVSFSGIPSGHSYSLREIEKGDEYYLDAGDHTVDINWGNATIKNSAGAELTDGNDSDNHVELVNKLNANALGVLVLQKTFAEGSVIPASIVFHVAGPDGFAIDRRLTAADAAAGNENLWQMTLTGLPYGDYTVRESYALDAQGNRLMLTHDLTYSITVNGEAKVTQQKFEGETTAPKIKFALADDNDTSAPNTVTVQFTNHMQPKAGNLSIVKSFVDIPNDVAIPKDLDISVIATPVDANNLPIADRLPVTLPLLWNKTTGAYASVVKELPIGRYKLTEELKGDIPDYSLQHYLFAHNGIDIETGIIEIKADTSLALTLKNHYEKDHAHLYIAKFFSGALTADHFAERMFYLNIRKDNRDGDIVAQIEIDGGDGEWMAEAPALPVGTYYIEEVTAEGAEGTAFESGYIHMPSWEPSATVTLTKDALVVVNLTNHYLKEGGTPPTNPDIFDPTGGGGDGYWENGSWTSEEELHSLPETGDRFNFGLWLTVCLLSCAGMFVLALRRSSDRRKQ